MAFFGESMIKYHGFQRYNPATDIEEDTFFEGLYFDYDYVAFANHKGKKIVFWNGSDLVRLIWHDHKNKQELLKTTPAIHLCHDVEQAQALESMGIKAKVHPLFFGDINKYQVSYRQSLGPQMYVNAHPGVEGIYGIPYVLSIAKKAPDISFHVYGIDATTSNQCPAMENVTYHGWVAEEVMDKEIAEMQGCFQTVIHHPRLSQTCLKSAFMAQWPLSTTWVGIPYACTEGSVLEYLRALKGQKEPNLITRNIFLKLYGHQWETLYE
jgi:hypothetical protein